MKIIRWTRNIKMKQKLSCVLPRQQELPLLQTAQHVWLPTSD